MKISLVFAALFAALLVGCTTPLTQTLDNSRCIPATPQQLDFINYAVQVEQASNSVKTGWAVKSSDFENVYLVAARIYGPGLEGGSDPAVFAVAGDPSNPHTWLAVDGLARNFTDLPDASKSDAEITLSTDGVSESRMCVEQLEK